jgi:hypothetical protein
MTDRLPAPGVVPERARVVAGEPAGRALDLLVAGDPDPAGVEAVDEGRAYEGDGAGDLGRLAAAVAAAETRDVRLHHPEADATSAGPWLVIEPLAGRLATVHAGRGRVTVDCDRPDPPDRPAATGGRVRALCEAASPTHEHYPVGSDREGLFTTGMTTFTLAGVDVGVDPRDDDVLRVEFRVATTPATAASDVRERFDVRPWVRSVRYEPVVGVERSDPPERLREAAERAVTAVLGDWEYDWFPEPTAFSRLPGGRKLALGTGLPGADRFDREAYERCRALIERTVAGWGER